MTKSKFRLLVVFSMLFSILGGVFDVLFPGFIEEELLSCQEEIEEEIFDSAVMLIVVGLFSVVGVAMAIISFFGLLKFWGPARHIYLAGFLIFIPIIPALGITITSGVAQILYDVGSLTSGMILALIYFSPVKELFKPD